MTTSPASPARQSPRPGSASAPHGTRQAPEATRMQGHWLLATLGKRVLRPGGIELTRRMLQAAAPKAGQRVVELGPGVGRTAFISCYKQLRKSLVQRLNSSLLSW